MGGRRVALLVAIGLAACDASIGGGPSTPLPVIQSLLIAGDSLQIAWVEWRVPADSAFGPDVRPVAPALVQLSLILPGSGSVPFTAAPGVPGRFDAAVAVNPGDRYLLQGTVAGYPVSGGTTVPATLDIQTPAQDTVRIAPGSCFGVCELPYRWIAAGAAAFLYVQSRSQTGQFIQAGSTRDTAGVIQVFPSRSGPDTAMLTVFALEAQAAAFLLPTTPKSSLTGVFGLFGAASQEKRWIVWQ